MAKQAKKSRANRIKEASSPSKSNIEAWNAACKAHKRRPKPDLPSLFDTHYDPFGVFLVLRSGPGDGHLLQPCGVTLLVPPEVDYSHLVPSPPGAFGRQLLRSQGLLDHSLRTALAVLQRHGHDIENLSMRNLDLEICTDDSCRIAVEMLIFMNELNHVLANESDATPHHLADAAECAALICQRHAQLQAIQQDSVVLDGHHARVKLDKAAKATAEKRRAERDRRDRELFPDGPADDESIRRQGRRSAGIDPDDTTKRNRRAEDAARRRKLGPLEKKQCQICKRDFSPKTERAKECDKCKNLSRTRKKARYKKYHRS